MLNKTNDVGVTKIWKYINKNRMFFYAINQIKLNISKYIITSPKSILANLKLTEYHFSRIYILRIFQKLKVQGISIRINKLKVKLCF